MSSEQGFRNVPGVLDGWELIHACRQAESGEAYLTRDGSVNIAKLRTTASYPIIRKIEQPARYRPFANAEEFKPHIGMYVEVVKETSECEMDLGDTLAIVGVSYDSVLLYGGWITFKDAFECLKFVDGTPVGMKIDE
jgi:hypothetical protein